MTAPPLLSRTARLLSGVLWLIVTASVATAGPKIGLVYATNHLQALAAGKPDPQSAYRKAIEDQGGEIVILGQTDPAAELAKKLSGLDGVLLPGGIDIDPKAYGEERHPKLEKTDESLDRMQFAVLRHAQEHTLPVLGICLGHQTINVFLGGSLYQDIPSQVHPDVPVVHRGGTPPAHPITIQPDSMLHEILGADRLPVNSYHHQAINRLAPGLVATARSEDGLIEAVEGTGKQFILGVQFHPERSTGTDPRMKSIFKRFVREARDSNREAKQEHPEKAAAQKPPTP